MPKTPENLTGRRFGKWFVEKFSHRNSAGQYYWMCRCRCGTIQPVRGTALKQHHSRGCLKCSKGSTTHGHARGGKDRKLPPEYWTWNSMLRRCLQPADADFKNYGGRGITVCKRWQGRDGFANFFADMGRRPQGTSLDRKDNNGNYEPGNCRWATRAQQIRNRRNTRLVTCAGRTQCIKDWSVELQVDYRVLHHLLQHGFALRLTENEVLLARQRSLS